MNKQSTTSKAVSCAYLHYCANKGKKLTYREISSELGVSERAFGEWVRGTNQPMVLKAFLKLLAELEPSQIQSVIKDSREKNDQNE